MIYKKLKEFYKKFYINEIIKGILLFLGLGLLYFIFISLLENYFWLSGTIRGLLFWTFIVVEVFLVVKLILIPILKLGKISKGISFEQSSEILQNHFPNEVGDKLKNLLQLHNFSQSENSELLLASIDQKSKELLPIPFLNAVNFKSNLKYVPLAMLPFLIFLYFFISGKQQDLAFSFDRVANYDQFFEKPAPFQFQILNKNLQVKEGDDFVLEFKTTGDLLPENVSIYFLNEKYFAEKIKPGVFKFVFSSVNVPLDFYFEANSFTSKKFHLGLLNLPSIQDLAIDVIYPSYLNKKAERFTSGNLVVPEGSIINWQIQTQHTNQINFVTDSVSTPFLQTQSQFHFKKKINKSIDYQLISSNTIQDYKHQINYKIEVLKDNFPTIEVLTVPDSIANGKTIYHGKASDDYGISKLRVAYYDVKMPNQIQYFSLPISDKISSKFVYQFPNGLHLNEGTTYSYYFEVIDNDAVNNFKSTKSSVYLHNELNVIEKQDENLNNQMQQINALEKSLTQSKSSDKKSNEMNQMLKQNSNLDYKDIKKLQDFFNSEIENNKKIEDAAKKLSEKLDEKSKKDESKKAEELQKRLDNLQKEQEKNKKLYDELKKYTDKLTKEELLEKMQQAKQNAAQQKKSMEQLVEQTKRFYVEQKAEQTMKKLEELATKQENLSTENQNSNDKQEELNKEFENIKEDLNDLKQENEGLKKPMDLPNMDADAEDAKQEMQKASDQLKKNNQNTAKQNQKKAANKMKEMAKKMASEMQGGEMEQLEEDAKSLRQILKNLLTFSFTQESTMKEFRRNGSQSFHINRLLKDEQKLKNQFKFIDDSLHTLASRQIAIQDVVNKNVGEIHYNIDQSLHHLVENNLGKGISHQQYVINHSNILADLLSEALSNMQNQMQAQSSGQGKPKPGQGDPQLSDIIQKQKGLQKQFGEGLDKKEGKKGDKDGDKPGQQPNEQEAGKDPGNEGKNGQDGGEAESGELLEIYKEQQQLREALEKALANKPGNSGLDKTLAEMKKLERNLLRKGFSNELLNQFKNLNHELLKLDEALKEQGQDDKRQGNTNKDNFISKDVAIPKSVLEYINGTEILQKNTLPLQPKYDNLVKEYFK